MEKLVTPLSLQGTSSANARKNRRQQKWVLSITAALLVLLFVINGVSSALSNRGGGDTITVGGKDFTEQVVLCHMVADLIEENTDLTVKRQPMLGGTQVCTSAVRSGEIDLYIDYTGTCYADTLGYTPISDVEKVYQTVVKDFDEKYNLKVLKQMNFNNTYTLAVKPGDCGEVQPEDLQRPGQSLQPAGHGPPTLSSHQTGGLPARSEKEIQHELQKSGGHGQPPRYLALSNGESDVVDAFSTDGLLKKFGLTVLEDDQRFFPAPITPFLIRSEVPEAHPELEDLLGQLGAVLTDDVMGTLNYQVTKKKESGNGRQTFLQEQGLIA